MLFFYLGCTHTMPTKHLGCDVISADCMDRGTSRHWLHHPNHFHLGDSLRNHYAVTERYLY